MTVSQGYFLIALGEKYIYECYLLGKTLRYHGDTRPISLLIHKEHHDIAAAYGMFDKLVYFVIDDPILWSHCHTGFERFCLYPRIFFNEFVPYDETMIVDSDVLCQYNPDHVWDYMQKQPLCVCMIGHKNNPLWHWGHVQEVSNAYGKHVPETHGGFFYIRKNDPQTKKFFEYCREVFYDYDKYHCKRQFRGGKTDEIIFAIAYANFGMVPIEFTEYPIMTFNYDTHVAVPSRLQTINGTYMSNYIPFVHMFDKSEGHLFQSLYNRIMSSNANIRA